jgi:hypothetical protein
MVHSHKLATAATAVVALMAALLLTACGDLTDFPAPSAPAGCTRICTTAPKDPFIPTPVAVPTLDPGLVAWRTAVHDRVAALTKDLGAIGTCGGAHGDDRADCRQKVTVLMTDARSMRDAMTGPSVPFDATDDAGKITDALDLILQGCIHDDAALASNKEFVWLPGDTTSRGFQQLVTVDDGLGTS